MAVAGPEGAAEDAATEVDEVLLQSTPTNNNNMVNSNSNSQMERLWMSVAQPTELASDVELSVATDAVDYLGC